MSTPKHLISLHYYCYYMYPSCSDHWIALFSLNYICMIHILTCNTLLCRATCPWLNNQCYVCPVGSQLHFCLIILQEWLDHSFVCSLIRQMTTQLRIETRGVSWASHCLFVLLGFFWVTSVCNVGFQVSIPHYSGYSAPWWFLSLEYHCRSTWS